VLGESELRPSKGTFLIALVNCMVQANRHSADRASCHNNQERSPLFATMLLTGLCPTSTASAPRPLTENVKP
jgi:hypothetical protein